MTENLQRSLCELIVTSGVKFFLNIKSLSDEAFCVSTSESTDDLKLELFRNDDADFIVAA
uniref:Uncharacterized protein n=1 Tax=Romanomermis culicivorax TaxID=13658 RepID=A0A915HSD5_ROMCU